MVATTIEWCDETWGPVTGCEYCSLGCGGCYAATLAATRLSHNPRYAGLAVLTDEGPRFTGEIRTHEDRLDEPLRWRKPRRIFVCSQSDLFHPGVPTEFIAKVWAIMAMAPQHTFQVLTKRPARMRALLNSKSWKDLVQTMAVQMGQSVELGGLGQPTQRRAMSLDRLTVFDEPGPLVLPNVEGGCSIETDEFTWRADHVRATPLAVRWLSLEPLLGFLPSLDLAAIDWIAVGGETGRHARPMHPDWARDLLARTRCPTCTGAGQVRGATGKERCPACLGLGHGPTRYHFKQRGDWTWEEPPPGRRWPQAYLHSDPLNPQGSSTILWKVGKKRAGRQLDGREWDEQPAVAA
jgi:protein gp37